MIVESSAAETPAGMDGERLRVIEKVIGEIRPQLQKDGGDCVLVGCEGKKVMVKLTGACVFCKLSGMTIEGIQTRLVEELGELVRVVPVMGGVAAG